MNTEEYFRLKEECTAQNVTLIAVSKTKPAAAIEALYALGHRDFGENYVQELVDKEASLPKDIHWHFIGHLQSNKVKMIAPFVHLIHAVDSFKLLQEIAERLNTSLAKLAIAWCLKNPRVSTVILGASKALQLKENLTALDVVPLLTNEIMLEIDEITGTKPKVVIP